MFNSVSCDLYSFFQANALYVPGYGEILQLNATELISGIPLPDDLLKTLIACIEDDDSKENAFERCALEIPIPFSFQLLQKISNKIYNSSLIAPVLSAINDTNEAVVDPVLEELPEVQKNISDAFVNLDGALSSEAESEAKRLVEFAETIEATSSKTLTNDPFQDISEHLASKARISDGNKDAPSRNTENLKKVFANKDLKTIKKFGATYNDFVPNYLIFAYLREIVDF